jgi:hypothetical protein
MVKTKRGEKKEWRCVERISSMSSNLWGIHAKRSTTSTILLLDLFQVQDRMVHFFLGLDIFLINDVSDTITRFARLAVSSANGCVVDMYYYAVAALCSVTWWLTRTHMTRITGEWNLPVLTHCMMPDPRGQRGGRPPRVRHFISYLYFIFCP